MPERLRSSEPKGNKLSKRNRSTRHSCSHVLAQAVLQMFRKRNWESGLQLKMVFIMILICRGLLFRGLQILEKKMNHNETESKICLKEEPGDKSVEFLKKTDKNIRLNWPKNLLHARSSDFYENVMPK